MQTNWPRNVFLNKRNDTYFDPLRGGITVYWVAHSERKDTYKELFSVSFKKIFDTSFTFPFNLGTVDTT